MNTQKNHQMMEQAIEKATKLITLLTKENHDYQLKLQKMESILQLITDNNEQLTLQLAQLKSELSQQQQRFKLQQKQFIKQQSVIKQLHKELEIFNLKSNDSQNKVKQKNQKIKILHEKISDLTVQQLQCTKIIEKNRIQILAIENQNDYLLGQLEGQQMKQHQWGNYQSYAQQQFRGEVQNRQRTKQAFARRCQQYALENTELRKQLHLLSKQNQKIMLKENKNINAEHDTSEQQNNLKTTPKLQKIEQILQLICKKLHINDIGIINQLQEINKYVGQNLQHIGITLKSIIQTFGIQNWQLGYENLLEINIILHKLSSYVGNLTIKQSIS